jgi:hypothetical protein
LGSTVIKFIGNHVVDNAELLSSKKLIKYDSAKAKNGNQIAPREYATTITRPSYEDKGSGTNLVCLIGE